MSKEADVRVLEETPDKVLAFLRAVGTRTDIMNHLAIVGYSDAVHEEGWKLLMAASGFGDSKGDPEPQALVRQAIAELDGWDEQGFTRIHAALERFHPEVDAALFNGIAPASGASSVVSVGKLLDRLDAFEKGSKEQKAALKTLASRGVDEAERARLRKIVNVAQSTSGPVPSGPPGAEQIEKLKQLYAWYKDWSQTARAVIRRRDWLQLMGLSPRKRRSTGSDDEGDTGDIETDPTEPGMPAVVDPQPENDGNGAGAPLVVA